MGRNSCCVKQKLRKGLWSPEEDEKLYNYITRFGVGCWSSVPKLAGLQRCGKSCRLRWINYLRPDLKRGMFSQDEEDLIINLHEALGNRWAQIAAQLPGRTDNEIKNFWNSSLKKKLLKQGVDPSTHKPINEAKEEEGLQSSDHNQQTYHLSTLLCSNGAKAVSTRETIGCKQVYDPLFLSEFQANVDHDGGFQSNFVSHCHQNNNLVRPYEQRQNNHPDPICGFNSMPNLTNYDHQDPQYSRMTKFVMNEAKESSNVSFQQAMMQLNSTNNAFSWEHETKLDSVFQFQFSGIQIEERNDEKLQNHDFATYSLTPLPQSMNVFDHRI